MTDTVPVDAPAHIVVVINENQSFQDVIGNPNAPFVNSLVAEGSVFASYNAVAHLLTNCRPCVSSFPI
jgi:hypothetical protein